MENGGVISEQGIKFLKQNIIENLNKKAEEMLRAKLFELRKK
jgi:hypothetical protein